MGIQLKRVELIIKDKISYMQELDTIKQVGKLKFGMPIQEGLKSAPWSWNDEQTNKVYGFEADIARTVARGLNINPIIITMESYRLITGLANFRCDIAIGAIRSTTSMKGIILTEPYYYLTQRIVTPANSYVFDLNDLRGDKVGVLAKSLGEYIIEETNKNISPTIKMIPYHDVLELFAALQFSEINAIFIDSPVALWYAKTNINENLHVSELAYKSGSYSMALREDDLELRDRINVILKITNIKEILEKYGLWDEAQQNK